MLLKQVCKPSEGIVATHTIRVLWFSGAGVPMELVVAVHAPSIDPYNLLSSYAFLALLRPTTGWVTCQQKEKSSSDTL